MKTSRFEEMRTKQQVEKAMQVQRPMRDLVIAFAFFMVLTAIAPFIN
jgi:hypothetical protein